MRSQTALFAQTVYERLRSVGYAVAWGPAEGTYVHRNQNVMCQTAIDQKADYLFLLDSDMGGATDVPEKLLRRVGVGRDIVGCDYRCRMPPHFLNSRKLNGEHPTGEEIGMEEMDYIPSGMMAIRRQVLLTLKYPWFWNYDGEKIEDFRGNDVNFCRDARAAGFKVWCDHDLSNEIVHRVPTDLQRKWKEW
jgi:hypothetical protein